jgi:hypothetical protein
VTVERRFVDATVDVVVDDWRTRWAAVETVSPQEWDVIDREWTAELCDVLDSVADGLLELVGGIRQGVAHAVASVLMTFGVPPLLAQILGRLVANWLMEGLSPVGAIALRLKELGVLLCASSGELDHCACLSDVVTMLGIKEFKKELHEALGIDSDGRGHSTPARDQRPDGPTYSNRDAADQAAGARGGVGLSSDPIPPGGSAGAEGARPGGEAAGDGTRTGPTGAPGGGRSHTAGGSSPADRAPNNTVSDGGASRGGWNGGSPAGPAAGANGGPRGGSSGPHVPPPGGGNAPGGPAAPGPTGDEGPSTGGEPWDGSGSSGPAGGGGRRTDTAGGASGAGSTGTGPSGPAGGAPGGAAPGPGSGPRSGPGSSGGGEPWDGSGSSGPAGGGGTRTDAAGGASGAGSTGTGPSGPAGGAPGGAAPGPGSGPRSGPGSSGGDTPATPWSAGAGSTGAAPNSPDRPIADASEVVRGATATVPPAVFG